MMMSVGWRDAATQAEGFKVLGIIVVCVALAIAGAMFMMAIFARVFNLVFHEWDYNKDEEEETDDMDEPYDLFELEDTFCRIFSEIYRKSLIEDQCTIRIKDAAAQTTVIMAQEAKDFSQAFIAELETFEDDIDMLEDLVHDIIASLDPHHDPLDDLGLSQKDFL